MVRRLRRAPLAGGVLELVVVVVVLVAMRCRHRRLGGRAAAQLHLLGLHEQVMARSARP